MAGCANQGERLGHHLGIAISGVDHKGEIALVFRRNCKGGQPKSIGGYHHRWADVAGYGHRRLRRAAIGVATLYVDNILQAGAQNARFGHRFHQDRLLGDGDAFVNAFAVIGRVGDGDF